jgi:cell wall-associated NlpC family hydrolase
MTKNRDRAQEVNNLAQAISHVRYPIEDSYLEKGLKETYLFQEGVRLNIRRLAMECLGLPYKYGVRRWDGPLKQFPMAFDCSSFVHAVYKAVAIDIPMRSLEQASFGEPTLLSRCERARDELLIGDLIFFKGDRGAYDEKNLGGVGHVLMYIGEPGDRKMVIGACGMFPYYKADKRRVGRVILIDLATVLRREDYRGARRILSVDQVQSG